MFYLPTGCGSKTIQLVIKAPQDLVAHLRMPSILQVDLGPVGHFDSMKSLVAAARLLVQAKIAGGDTTTSSRRVNRPEDRLGWVV